MKLKFFALSLIMVAGVNFTNAQNKTNNYVAESNKHDFRLSVSDGTTMNNSDILGLGISDAITGTKRTDSKYSLGYGFGYRYRISRFRIGADLGFAKSTSKLALYGDNSPTIKEKNLRFLVLPTAEFIYYKRRLVELYGTAAAGVLFDRHSESPLNNKKSVVNNRSTSTGKTDLTTGFAYQVNPIGLRIGNERIGGFVEAGLGHKGFATAGISLKF